MALRHGTGQTVCPVQGLRGGCTVPCAALRKSLGLTQSLPCGSCQAPSIPRASFHREAARSPQEDGDVDDRCRFLAETNGSNCRKKQNQCFVTANS